MKIKNLLIKKEKGLPMNEVAFFDVDENGIVGGVDCHWQRQVLLLPQTTLDEFGIQAGELRENIVVDGGDLHSIESGTELFVGKDVVLRVTYLCEPCKKIMNIAPVAKFLNKRGLLTTVIKPGKVKVGDTILLGEKNFEHIPYELKDRVVRYLEKIKKPIYAKELVAEIGLSASYCRALPHLLKGIDEKYKKLVVFSSKK